jgi:hypothetical protein
MIRPAHSFMYDRGGKSHLKWHLIQRATPVLAWVATVLRELKDRPRSRTILLWIDFSKAGAGNTADQNIAKTSQREQRVSNGVE